MGLAPEVLTPMDAVIAGDGGFLVGAADARSGAMDPGDVAAQSGWRLRSGSRVASPTLVTLAPGLVLFKLPADAADGQLIDDKRATIGKVTVGPKTAVLGAPKIKKITHDSGGGRKPFVTITVELAAVPDGAVALVLADSKGMPRSWHLVDGKATKQLAFERRRCRILANGTIESKPGERVTAYWVDASGRKSAASAASAIVAGRIAADTDD